jgi:hypothetical protein
MKNPVIVLNSPGDKGQLKASILCDRLTWSGITHLYAKVGDCHTVTIDESDVARAL